MTEDLIGYFCAAIAAFLGIVGYAKTGSFLLLGGGVALGVLLAYNANLNSRDPPRQFGETELHLNIQRHPK